MHSALKVAHWLRKLPRLINDELSWESIVYTLMSFRYRSGLFNHERIHGLSVPGLCIDYIVDAGPAVIFSSPDLLKMIQILINQ